MYQTIEMERRMGARSPLMTPTQLAEYIGKPTKTLANWRSRGIGPPWIKLENHDVRYRPDDVDAWLEKNAARGSAA